MDWFPHYVWTAALSANSNFVGSKVYVCSGVTCHLHFWLDDQGLLCATAITRGWNGHQIRVGIQSELWRRKFSHRSCRESNSQPFNKFSHRSCWESNTQPFNHESGTLRTCPPGSQYLIYHHCHLIHFVSPVPKVHSLEYQPCCAFLTFCTSGWKP